MHPMQTKVKAKCVHCGFPHQRVVYISSKLGVGDMVYSDPNKATFDRCTKCKRKGLEVTEAEDFTSISKPQGFWTVPQEGTGESSG